VMLEELQLLRIRKLYRQAKPQPAYRSKRPLGIPTIRDRVAQMAVKLVIDADVSKCLDTLSHEWLVKFIERRIGDRRIIRLIQKWYFRMCPNSSSGRLGG
jgi:retron-type reverse transcriptase